MILAIAVATAAVAWRHSPAISSALLGLAPIEWLDRLSSSSPTFFNILVTFLTTALVTVLSFAARRVLRFAFFAGHEAGKPSAPVVDVDQIVTALKRAPAGSAPWVDLDSGRSLMDVGMPPVGNMPLQAVEAKTQLYGGRHVRAFNALELVALRHTFDRETVAVLADRIRGDTERCSSFTLRASRGAGLSLALAQLVREFTIHGGTCVASVIGDRDRTRRMVAALTLPSPEAMAAWVRTLEPSVERVLIVVDDVSIHAGIDDAKLARFSNYCQYGFVQLDKPKLTFVFGTCDPIGGLHDGDPIKLELTDSDRAACYTKMAQDLPTIMEGLAGGAPAEARDLGNDAQALIDFYLQHGSPHKLTVENWLARIDDLSSSQLSILELAATAQLLALPLPEPVALALCRASGMEHLADAHDIVAANDRLTMEQGSEGGGLCVGLSCPWRAKSILRRQGKLEDPFLVSAFREMVDTALRVSEYADRAAAEVLEFARHVFQRIGKNEYYRFDGKARVGSGLLSEFIDPLNALASGWKPELKARWAGSIAPWVDDQQLDRALRERCARFVIRTSSECLSAIMKGTADLSPSMTVSLLRASRILLHSGLLRDGAGQLARDLAAILASERLFTLAQDQWEGAAEERVYRTNELLTAYGRFRAQLVMPPRRRQSAFPPPQLCSEVTDLLKKVQGLGVGFDAATWIERARFVWVDRHDPEEAEKALCERRDYLNAASECVKMNPVTQGTWGERVERAQQELTAGPFR